VAIASRVVVDEIVMGAEYAAEDVVGTVPLVE
jgi:hypothetical protein